MKTDSKYVFKIIPYIVVLLFTAILFIFSVRSLISIPKTISSREKSSVFTHYTGYLDGLSDVDSYEFDVDKFASDLDSRKGLDGIYTIYDYELTSLIKDYPDKYDELLKGKEVYIISTLLFVANGKTELFGETIDFDDTYPGETVLGFCPLPIMLSYFNDGMQEYINNDNTDIEDIEDFNPKYFMYVHSKDSFRNPKRGALQEKFSTLAVTALFGGATKGTLEYLDSVYVLRVVLPSLTSGILFLSDTDIKEVI